MKCYLSMAGIVALSAGVAFAGDCKVSTCDAGQETVASMGMMAGDIVETAVAAGSFKTLVAAVQAAGLVDTLKGKGPFTVFAPTDEAFAKLPKGTLESLLLPENKAKLAAILTYHVVPARVVAADVKTGAAATANGQRIDLRVTEGKVTVDNANVVKTDILCSNGVIHVIDTVILPSDKDIVDTAVAAGQFTTLAMLLDRAGLVDALKGAGPFTVFAPTDAAFAKLPKETVESLLKSENKETLAGILKFHVLSGRVFSDAAAKGASVATLQGQKVTTKSEGGKVYVQNASVVGADIDASNGVIHVIDTVILPTPGQK
jgi:transforming growth factor-beta-induced protein